MLCLLFFFVVGSLSQNPVAEGFSLRNPRLANPKGFGYRQEVEKRNELGRHRLSKEERKELLKELAQKRKGRSLQEYGAISGYVTSAKGPIEDVDIDVVDATTHDWVSYGETDATGYYLAEGLPTGSYKLWTWNHQGYVDEWYDNKMYFHEADEVPVNAPDTTKNIDFQLAPGGFIEGTVTSADKGPLEDIDITAYDASDPYPMRGVGGERTDSTGHYIVCLPAGNYKVQTHDWYHGLYVNLYYNNTPYWNTATIVSVTVGDTAKNKDFSLYVGGKIKGTVSGAKGPLYGIGITAFSNTNGEWMAMGESDGDGNYTLPCLPSDNLKLLACPGMQYYKGIDTTHAWEWYNNKGAWTSADVISVSAGDSVLGRDFNLELCGFITGTVSSAKPGINDAEVTSWVYANDFYGWIEFYEDETGADGSYKLTNLRTGDYKVSASHSNYVTQWYNDKPDSASADLVSVTMPNTMSGIDFGLTGVEEQEVRGQKSEFRLYQNRPNPFVRETVIRYTCPCPSKVSLKIYDISGRLVKTLVNEKKMPGYYTINWDAKELRAGIYFYRLAAGNFSTTKKLILLR